MKVLFDHNLPRRLREHLPVGIADLMKKGLRRGSLAPIGALKLVGIADLMKKGIINGWQAKGGKGIQRFV